MENIIIENLIKNPNYLTNLLNTRLNEYKMQTETLADMIDRDSQVESIDLVKHGIDKTLDDIALIKHDISIYNDKDKWNELVEEYNKANGLLEEDDDIDVLNSKDHNVIEDTMGAYEMMNQGKYSVDFRGCLSGIEPWRVLSVGFSDNINQLNITITDCVVRYNGVIVPIIAVLRDCLKHGIRFELSISHKSDTNATVYTERFENCKIIFIQRSNLKTDENQRSTITFEVDYDSVAYETAA